MKWDKDKEPVETNSSGDQPPTTPANNSNETNATEDKTSDVNNEEYTDVLESGLGIDE